jgi:prepilin-type N-terminal cleavage/methylation domain-containing protein
MYLHRAFTLLELLVLIALIAILVALLLPLLLRSKQDSPPTPIIIHDDGMD